MQIRQRIFKHTSMQVLYFFLQNLQTFDISHAFLPLTIAKLSTFKNVRFLLANPVCAVTSCSDWRPSSAMTASTGDKKHAIIIDDARTVVLYRRVADVTIQQHLIHSYQPDLRIKIFGSDGVAQSPMR